MLQRHLLLEWQRADVLASTAGLDAVVVFHGWRAEDVEDEGELVVILVLVSRSGQSFPTEDSQSLPGNSGLPLSISARMHPTLQTSIALVYSLKVNMISGARYHLVATYSVMKPELSSVEAADLARPKSQTFKSQLALSKRLEGLRSRCSTFAECIALRARRVW